MVTLYFDPSLHRDVDATNVRFLFDAEEDVPDGDPLVTDEVISVQLAGPRVLDFFGDFAAIADALRAQDLDALLLTLPLISLDGIVARDPIIPYAVAGDLDLSGLEIGGFLSAGDEDAAYAQVFAGNDTIVSAAGADTLSGFDGDDLVLGMDGSDHVRGGGGNDEINGNKGADTVLGGADRDFVRGGQDGDLVSGDEGDDWHVNGNNGNDTVRGDAGNDAVFGGRDDDLVFGNAGNDFLSGDLGDDTLIGGTGADVFAFDHDSGFDAIEDLFGNLDGDRIGIRANVNGSLIATGLDVIARSVQSPQGAILDLGAGNAVLIEGYDRTNLREEFFIIF
ncbi:MAG: hypothetical protein IT561_00105 [Alphaproteobacteria bacterium]|nr:hypothetical protein [Alphaproteobacteria bacterium]